MSIDIIVKALDKIERLQNHTAEEQRVLADRLNQVEQKGTQRNDVMLGSGGATLGDMVLKGLEPNRDLLSKTDRLKIEVKAAGDVTGIVAAAQVERDLTDEG